MCNGALICVGLQTGCLLRGERTKIGTMPTAYMGGFTAANHSRRWRSLLLALSKRLGLLALLAEVGAEVLALAAGKWTAAACLCCSSRSPTSPYKFGWSWPVKGGRHMVRLAVGRGTKNVH